MIQTVEKLRWQTLRGLTWVLIFSAALFAIYYAYFINNYVYASMDLIFMFFLLASRFLPWIKESYIRSLVVFIISGFLFLVYLVITGLGDGFVILWSLPIPVICYFLIPGRKGDIIVTVIGISMILCQMYPVFAPEETLYKTGFIVRYGFAYSVIALVTRMYEVARHNNEVHLHSMTQKFQQLAAIDPLTELLNRRAMFEQLNREFSRSIRHQHELTLLMIDLDHFKSINDNYGHEIGDLTLKECSQVIQSQIRQSDILGRYGGEEFLLALVETDQNAGKMIAESIRKSIHVLGMQYTNDTSKKLGASIGISSLTKNTTNLDQIIREADDALFQAKRAGRNQVINWQHD